MIRTNRLAQALAIAGTGVLLAACSSSSGPPAPPMEIKVLSTRADMVSGGDAFVQIVPPAGTSATNLVVQLNGVDITSSFAMRADGRLTGLVTGLVNGSNTLFAKASDATDAKLAITNYPIGGPIISGPQIQPWICATPTAQAEAGTSASTIASGLSTAAVDSQCNIKTEMKLYYKTTTANCLNVLPDPSPPAATPTNGCFKPYNPASAAPADMATTTTDAGVTMPYIVRVERGTMNRGIYDIAVLFDPAKDWKPYAPQAGWNGKVVYTFGASTGQPRKQYRSEQSWVDDSALSRGFMVALNSLTDSLYNSNRVMMSETVMMMKEHIIDAYGPIRYTIGNGCSGGSINQLTNATIAPGLVDGIQPSCTYPDSQTTGLEVSDCQLLVNVYNSVAWKTATAGLPQAIIDAKKAAINGHIDQTGCHAWTNLFSNIDRPGNYVPKIVANTNGDVVPFGAPRNNCQLPASLVYDPVTNPTGIRCDGGSAAVAIWGKVPGTEKARDTRDNVGVQYGLKALFAGTITAEEFVVLNEAIGGTDADQNSIPTRSTGDAEALAIAYKAGIVSSGKQLAKTAIIDLRGFDDSTLPANIPAGSIPFVTNFGIHHIWRSFSLRDRLDKANGNHDNHVMWRYGTGLSPTAASGLTLQSFLAMDKWMSNLKADVSSTAIEQKIVKAKPAGAFDFCYLSTDTGFTTKVTDPAVCNQDKFLAPHASPRQVAGGPLSENILKCQLKPLSVTDYAPVTLSGPQISRLLNVFTAGVCDWSKPGVGQQEAGVPLSYAAGAGGAAIPAAPVSTPL
ncbi:MAG: hypothetical protein H7234_09990 [Herminiimonas sp.]|nr:hypothetical protein [Herminiimonas sp.]